MSYARLSRRTQLEGKKIKRITLERGVSDQTGLHYSHLRAIEFTDGTRVTFSVMETGSDYAITGQVHESGLTHKSAGCACGGSAPWPGGPHGN